MCSDRVSNCTQPFTAAVKAHKAPQQTSFACCGIHPHTVIILTKYGNGILLKCIRRVHLMKMQNDTDLSLKLYTKPAMILATISANLLSRLELYHSKEAQKL